MSNENKPLPVLQRLDQLESVSQNLIKTVNEVNQKNRESTAMVVEVVGAMMKLMGDGFEQKVEDLVKENRKKRFEEESEKAKKALEDLVASGTFVSQDTITLDSVVVGREFDPEGNVLGVGRVQVEYSQFTSTAKDKLLGQGVGAVVEVSGGKFEVLEIYHPNPSPPVAPEPVMEEVK